MLKKIQKRDEEVMDIIDSSDEISSNYEIPAVINETNYDEYVIDDDDLSIL